MSHPLTLRELIDELECQFDAYTLYFSKKVGRIFPVWHEEYSVPGESDCVRLLEVNEIQTGIAADVLENETDYIKLPSKSDIDEDNIMEKFCMSRKNSTHRDLLLKAIKSHHEYRRFKDTLNKLKIVDDWYLFRDEAYKQIAIDWCNQNRIDFIEPDFRQKI
jgi:Uncharacterised protein family (UPF0158).